MSGFVIAVILWPTVMAVAIATVYLTTPRHKD